MAPWRILLRRPPVLFLRGGLLRVIHCGGWPPSAWQSTLWGARWPPWCRLVLCRLSFPLRQDPRRSPLSRVGAGFRWRSENMSPGSEPLLHLRRTTSGEPPQENASFLCPRAKWRVFVTMDTSHSSVCLGRRAFSTIKVCLTAIAGRPVTGFGGLTASQHPLICRFMKGARTWLWSWRD